MGTDLKTLIKSELRFGSFIKTLYFNGNPVGSKVGVGLKLRKRVGWRTHFSRGFFLSVLLNLDFGSNNNKLGN